MANELQEIQFEYKAFRQLEREANRAKGTSEYDAKCADVNSAAYGLALDVPKLIDEVERLQTALDAVTRERDAAVRERGVAVDTLDGAEGLLWYVMNTINSDAVIYDGWEARRDGNDLTITQREQTARQHDDAAEGSGER